MKKKTPPLSFDFNCPKCKYKMNVDADIGKMVKYEVNRIIEEAFNNIQEKEFSNLSFEQCRLKKVECVMKIQELNKRMQEISTQEYGD